MRYAPVVLFVYNRLLHTRKTVESLQQNLLAEDSDLVIFSDGPKNKSDVDSVEAVRNYIGNISHFKSVTIVKQASNKGLSNSIIDGVTTIINEHEKIIVLEDDMVTSPFFLKFMNDALNYYDLEEKVAGIHAYVYPVQKGLPETFFLRGADCWGWATWKRAWGLFEKDGQLLLDKLVSSGLLSAFDYSGAFRKSDILREQIKGNNDSWAIRWYASAFVNNKYTLHPGISLVNNIGNDSSGTHSTTNSVFQVDVANRPINVEPIDIIDNLQVREIYEEFGNNYLNPNLITKLRNIFRHLTTG